LTLPNPNQWAKFQLDKELPMSAFYSIQKKKNLSYGFIYFQSEKGQKAALDRHLQVFGRTLLGINCRTLPVENLFRFSLSGFQSEYYRNTIDLKDSLCDLIPKEYQKFKIVDSSSIQKGKAFLEFPNHELAWKVYPHLFLKFLEGRRLFVDWDLRLPNKAPTVIIPGFRR